MSKVHFIHVRNRNQDGKISNRGGTTVAFREIPESGMIEYAYAFCNPRDNFSRHLGRVKSEGRLKSTTHRHVSMLPYDDFIRQTLTALQEEVSI